MSRPFGTSELASLHVLYALFSCADCHQKQRGGSQFAAVHVGWDGRGDRCVIDSCNVLRSWTPSEGPGASGPQECLRVNSRLAPRSRRGANLRLTRAGVGPGPRLRGQGSWTPRPSSPRPAHPCPAPPPLAESINSKLAPRSRRGANLQLTRAGVGPGPRLRGQGSRTPPLPIPSPPRPSPPPPGPTRAWECPWRGVPSSEQAPCAILHVTILHVTPRAAHLIVV